ncbi:MAG: hypothetical protein U0X39_02585 [Bacteroidales bacterium]
MVYSELFATKSEAGSRERAIKRQKSQEYIRGLVATGTGGR